VTRESCRCLYCVFVAPLQPGLAGQSNLFGVAARGTDDQEEAWQDGNGRRTSRRGAAGGGGSRSARHCGLVILVTVLFDPLACTDII
jgi:hypothetical protein